MRQLKLALRLADEQGMSTFQDRQGNTVQAGDRVRIIDGTGKTGFMIDGAVTSSVGWYCIIESVSRELGCIFACREDDPSFRFCVNGKDVTLAPIGEVAPEILVHPAPSGAHDVRLVEHYGSAYSMYRVGNWEGTATLWHNTGLWHVGFKAVSVEDDLHAEGQHPNTAEGAWAAWSSCHPLLAGAAV